MPTHNKNSPSLTKTWLGTLVLSAISVGPTWAQPEVIAPETLAEQQRSVPAAAANATAADLKRYLHSLQNLPPSRSHPNAVRVARHAATAPLPANAYAGKASMINGPGLDRAGSLRRSVGRVLVGYPLGAASLYTTVLVLATSPSSG